MQAIIKSGSQVSSVEPLKQYPIDSFMKSYVKFIGTSTLYGAIGAGTYATTNALAQIGSSAITNTFSTTNYTATYPTTSIELFESAKQLSNLMLNAAVCSAAIGAFVPCAVVCGKTIKLTRPIGLVSVTLVGTAAMAKALMYAFSNSKSMPNVAETMVGIAVLGMAAPLLGSIVAGKVRNFVRTQNGVVA